MDTCESNIYENNRNYSGCSCNQNNNLNENYSEYYNDDNCPCNYNNMDNDCNCGFDEPTSVFPSNYMYAQSYVPIQYMNKTFTPEVGLRKGTIFPELVSPYEPCQSIREIEFIRATNDIGKGCNG